jgi:uncharacterized membrane protein YidH (DUF202 family)
MEALGSHLVHKPEGRFRSMNLRRLIAILLVAGGILAAVYGKVTYTKETHEAKLGDLELQLREKKTVNVPVWAGAGAIVLGAGLFAWRGRGGAGHARGSI